MRATVCLIIQLLALPALSAPQEQHTHPAPPPGANTPANPRQIMFEHDGKGITGFALYVRRDGAAPVRIDLGMPPMLDRRFTVDLTDLPDGVYEMEVAAYNRAGESPRVRTDPARFVMARGKSGQLPAGSTAARDTQSAGPPGSSSRKKGFFRGLWRVLVGSDEN